MKLRVFNAALFFGLAVWMLFRHPWFSPAFALVGASQLAIPIAVWRADDSPRSGYAALVAFLALGYLGLAYIFAGMAGNPTTLSFWVIFGAAAVILGPVLWLFHRSTLGRDGIHAERRA